MRVDSQFGIVEVRKRRRYSKFDPFIFPETATQVYHANHPEKKGNKIDWWIVKNTNPKGAIDTRYNVEVAYRGEQSRVTSASIEDDPIDGLRDEQADGEEVNGSSLQVISIEDGHDLIEEEDNEISSQEE